MYAKVSYAFSFDKLNVCRGKQLTCLKANIMEKKLHGGRRQEFHHIKRAQLSYVQTNQPFRLMNGKDLSNDTGVFSSYLNNLSVS